MPDDTKTEHDQSTPEDERLVTARIVGVKGEPVTCNGAPVVFKVSLKRDDDTR